MRITTFLIFACTLFSYADNLHSQNARVSINRNNVQLDDVLEAIESQTDYLFLYNNSIDVRRKVSIKAKEKPVSQVLDDLFKNTDVDYAMEGTHIVLSMHGASSAVTEQAKKVTGVVTDASGEPIIGANVVEKGTTNGTTTDIDGKFTINVSETAVLAISYIGYNTKEVSVNNQSTLNIQLVENTQVLDEVVVIGYGTQKKGDISSAISSVKSEKFVKVPTPDAAQLVRGQIAGLSIVSPDANPTSTSEVSLRGITTLKAGTSPLVLIDGVPGNLNTVSPDAIEQIDVLKDGSAAAIYGTRGTNGVILITTKNAKGEMPTEVDVNIYLSTQKITKKLDFFSADKYRNLVAQGKPGAYDYKASVNWLDEVTQSPLNQIYNVSLRGGSRTTNYVASFEYRNLNGIIKRSNNQMIYPRIDVTHRMFNNILKINAGVSGFQQKYFSGSDGGSYNSSVYQSAISYNPTTSIKDENGKWSESLSKTDYFNPVGLLDETKGENKATNLRMYSSINLTPIKGLDVKWLISSNIYNQTRGYYETLEHAYSLRNGRTGYASRGTTRSQEDLSELTAQYMKTIQDHTFTALAGYSYLKYNYENYYMQNYDFSSNDYTYNNMGNGSALSDGKAKEYSYQSDNKLVGYFGRLNYSYKGKYMLAASIRYEGSSKFGDNYKWGTFPAVSVAWNIKDEGFMKDVVVLNALKLRAGYGVTGTEPSDPYKSLNTLSFSTYTYYNGNWMKTIRPSSNANPDLKWEKKAETNIGLDFGFLEDRIYGSIDYYNRKTTDLLWDYTVPSPPYLYSSMMANAGSIRNRGLEVSLTFVPIQTKDIQWTTSMNFSTNKNTLLSLSNDKYVSIGYSDEGSTGEPIQTTTHRIQEGEPIGNFYGYKSVDIDENGHWIIEGADGNPKPIAQQTPEDKHVLGNGLPKYYLNWNNSVAFKGFDFTVTMRGAFDYQILNMASMQYGVPVMLSRGNIFSNSYDNIYGKRPLADDQELQYVSYFIEDGDYWKIDNVTLGYTFKFSKFKWVKNFRLYGTVSNLAVITGYSGIDPEVTVTGLAPGNDNKFRYPSARTFTIGASVTF